MQTKRVDEVASLHELFESCLPAFGGAYLRRFYKILDDAVGAGVPLTLAVAGPVTVSGQHQAWLIPLLETGWVAYLSTTDAVCYHDGHRCLDGRGDAVFEVPIFGDDGALRDEKTIRVTDMAFDEDVLLDQDKFTNEEQTELFTDVDTALQKITEAVAKIHELDGQIDDIQARVQAGSEPRNV